MSDVYRYIATYSNVNGGWCVYACWDNQYMVRTYHMGPYEDRSAADEEAQRLNKDIL